MKSAFGRVLIFSHSVDRLRFRQQLPHGTPTALLRRSTTYDPVMTAQRWDREKLLIGGEGRPASGGTYDVVNPSTEQVVGVAPQATREDALEAAKAAKDAFWTWSRTTPQERAELLRRAGDLLAKHNDELVPLVQAETGATQKGASSMQVPVAIGRFERYARGAMEPNQIPLPPQVMPDTPLAPGGVIGAVV